METYYSEDDSTTTVATTTSFDDDDDKLMTVEKDFSNEKSLSDEQDHFPSPLPSYSSSQSFASSSKFVSFNKSMNNDVPMWKRCLISHLFLHAKANKRSGAPYFGSDSQKLAFERLFCWPPEPEYVRQNLLLVDEHKQATIDLGRQIHSLMHDLNDEHAEVVETKFPVRSTTEPFIHPLWLNAQRNAVVKGPTFTRPPPHYAHMPVFNQALRRKKVRNFSENPAMLEHFGQRALKCMERLMDRVLRAHDDLVERRYDVHDWISDDQKEGLKSKTKMMTSRQDSQEGEKGALQIEEETGSNKLGSKTLTKAHDYQETDEREQKNKAGDSSGNGGDCAEKDDQKLATESEKLDHLVTSSPSYMDQEKDEKSSDWVDDYEPRGKDSNGVHEIENAPTMAVEQMKTLPTDSENPTDEHAKLFLPIDWKLILRYAGAVFRRALDPSLKHEVNQVCKSTKEQFEALMKQLDPPVDKGEDSYGAKDTDWVPPVVSIDPVTGKRPRGKPRKYPPKPKRPVGRPRKHSLAPQSQCFAEGESVYQMAIVNQDSKQMASHQTKTLE